MYVYTHGAFWEMRTPPGFPVYKPCEIQRKKSLEPI